MFNSKSTNADIAQFDWAQGDRAALLRPLHACRAPKAPAAGSSGWGTDVAGTDPRSVHAYLNGKGDFRTTWWNLYSSIYITLVPSATLERAMYSYHRMHHRVTLFKLGFAQSVAQTAADIEQKGIVAAAQNSIMREIKR